MREREREERGVREYRATSLIEWRMVTSWILMLTTLRERENTRILVEERERERERERDVCTCT